MTDKDYVASLLDEQHHEITARHPFVDGVARIASNSRHTTAGSAFFNRHTGERIREEPHDGFAISGQVVVVDVSMTGLRCRNCQDTYGGHAVDGKCLFGPAAYEMRGIYLKAAYTWSLRF